MTITFSDDYTYVYIKYDTGELKATPVRLLTDEDKEFIHQETGKDFR